MKTKVFKLNKKYVDYLERVKPELIEAEKTVERIKKSYMWQRCNNYFNVLACRGILKTRPTKSNGYTYEVLTVVVPSDEC